MISLRIIHLHMTVDENHFVGLNLTSGEEFKNELVFTFYIKTLSSLSLLTGRMRFKETIEDMLMI